MGINTARILIIDDEVTICESCSQVLKQEGYLVETSLDGVTGLEKFDDLKPDVVFLDLKMPGLSGMEVLEKIGEKDKNVVTIVITGFATIESAVESIKNGAFDFLPKPFTPNELRIIAKRGLDHRKLLLEAESLRREKERMREKFIAMVSHQLKVPLAAVRQYFEVILGGMAGELTSEQRQMLQRSQIRIDELLRLIDAWLSFSRIDAETVSQDFINFDLVEFIEEIVDFLKPVAKENNISLEVIARDRYTINGHKDFLREAFTNLISNGINYNCEGGKVTIDVQKNNDRIYVKITDTGIGISEDDLPHIFDEFYRSKKAKHVLGSGLGLSIVKRIIEAHKGRITVESTLNKGSTFSVYLPAKDKKELT